MNVDIRDINREELNHELFNSFIRHQTVTKCVRKVDEQWVEKNIEFIDDWSSKDYDVLIKSLLNTIITNGLVIGAFIDNKLKGFASVESTKIGSRKQYLDLSYFYVSEDMRRKGIGKLLFEHVKQWAIQHNAEKLYMSSHSAVETQYFYKAMGCTDAEELIQKHVEAEPCDRQLECKLQP